MIIRGWDCNFSNITNNLYQTHNKENIAKLWLDFGWLKLRLCISLFNMKIQKIHKYIKTIQNLLPISRDDKNVCIYILLTNSSGLASQQTSATIKWRCIYNLNTVCVCSLHMNFTCITSSQSIFFLVVLKPFFYHNCLWPESILLNISIIKGLSYFKKYVC